MHKLPSLILWPPLKNNSCKNNRQLLYYVGTLIISYRKFDGIIVEKNLFCENSKAKSISLENDNNNKNNKCRAGIYVSIEGT